MIFLLYFVLFSLIRLKVINIYQLSFRDVRKGRFKKKKKEKEKTKHFHNLRFTLYLEQRMFIAYKQRGLNSFSHFYINANFLITFYAKHFRAGISALSRYFFSVFQLRE